MRRKKFEKLTKKQLWQLRQQVVVNSAFVADYRNDMGYDENSIYNFFDGYYDYMWELAEEDGAVLTHNNVMATYDNADILWSWFNCYDDLTWIKYKAMEE